MARRTKAEALETKQHILKAALEIFSQKGYAVATLEEIAAQAGVTRGAVYWHFDGKVGLYSALIEAIQSRSSAVVQSAVTDGKSVTDVLRLVFMRLLEAVEQDAELRSAIELGLRPTTGIPELKEIRERQIEAGKMLVGGITAAMGQSAAAGELRQDIDPEQMARGFLALQNGLIQQWLADPAGFSLTQSGAALLQIFLAGIEPAV